METKTDIENLFWEEREERLAVLKAKRAEVANSVRRLRRQLDQADGVSANVLQVYEVLRRRWRILSDAVYRLNHSIYVHKHNSAQ